MPPKWQRQTTKRSIEMLKNLSTLCVRDVQRQRTPIQTKQLNTDYYMSSTYTAEVSNNTNTDDENNYQYTSTVQHVTCGMLGNITERANDINISINLNSIVDTVNNEPKINEINEIFPDVQISRVNQVTNTQNITLLNPNVMPFCPSKKLNNILTANNFPKNLNFVYSNLQGMLEACHYDEFINEISKSNNIHICAITETWLRHGVNSNKSMNMNEFRIFRSDRKPRKNDRNKGGGVALFVKSNIGCKLLKRSFDDDNDIVGAEYLFVEI